MKQMAIKRLIKDLKELQDNPLPFISASPLENNIFIWHANSSYYFNFY